MKNLKRFTELNEGSHDDNKPLYGKDVVDSVGSWKKRKYPELDKIADKLFKDVMAELSTHGANSLQTEMPYKAQYILEKLVKKLQEKI